MRIREHNPALIRFLAAPPQAGEQSEVEVLLNVRRRHEFLPNRTPPVEHKDRNVIRAVGHMSSCSQEKGIVKICHKKERGLSFDCSKRQDYDDYESDISYKDGLRRKRIHSLWMILLASSWSYSWGCEARNLQRWWKDHTSKDAAGVANNCGG